MAYVGEDLVDDGGICDICNHPQAAAAQRANGHVKLECALEPLRPGQPGRFGRFWGGGLFCRFARSAAGLGPLAGTMRALNLLFGANTPW